MSRIRIVEKTGSTNADLLGDDAAGEGDWLVALEQDSGRGRQGRGWVSQLGNFMGSTIVELFPSDPPAQSLSLAAGLALIEALDAAVPGQPLMLKWPNDLLLDGEKLAGILLERRDSRVVIGIGVNLAAAPRIEGRRVAHLGSRITPQAFAPIVAATMAQVVGRWRSTSPADFAEAWLARAHGIGTELKVHSQGAEPIAGRFEGIDPDGALRLGLADGSTEIVRSADVDLN